ncbi:MAG: hypothetical protein ABI051_00590 [Vicinamibacterales bacterium]
MTRQSYVEFGILVVGLSAAVASGVVAWKVGGPHGERLTIDPRVRRVYDATTGDLTMIAFDSDGDLIFDTRSYLTKGHLVRMDVDEDQDGKIDRREYFAAGEVLERTEILDKQGRVVRVELPTPAVAPEPVVVRQEKP